jgi:adenosylhomocysteine nucleosidase
LTEAVIGVICALRSEAHCLGRAIRRDDLLEQLPQGPLVSITGMGPAVAAAGAQRLQRAGVRALLSFGLAGGLDPTLAPGTLLLPAEVTAAGGAVFTTAGAWRAQLQQALGRLPSVGGRLFSAERAILTPSAKAELFQRSGAAAVDMESAAIAAVARAHALPFAVLRAVVDGADTAVPHAVACSTGPAGDTSLPRLLAALARRPADLPRLLPLMRGYRAATRALRSAVASGALHLPAELAVRQSA